VLYAGKIAEELGVSALTENRIMHAALGGDARSIAA
jgi:hypothetical protein